MVNRHIIISVRVPESGVCVHISGEFGMFVMYCMQCCIDGRRYVCCSECNVVSNECNEPTSCNLWARTVVKLCTLGVLSYIFITIINIKSWYLMWE